MNHNLKTDPAVFEAVERGDKTHEIRLNDRNFQVGDTLLLRETAYTGDMMARGAVLLYTGRTATRIVSHIQTGYGLADGWCILSFRTAAPVGANKAAAISTWEQRIYEKHPRSDSTYWPDDLQAKYMLAEITDLRAAIAVGAAAETAKAIYQVELDPAFGSWMDIKTVDVPVWTRKGYKIRTVFAGPQIDATTAPACDTCNDTGQMCVGMSGQESDGNGPVMEPCAECSYTAPATAPDVAKDAARYRWLRDQKANVAQVLDKRTDWVPPDEEVPGVGGYWMYEYRDGDDLDTAIDAAMGALPPADGGNP